MHGPRRSAETRSDRDGPILTWLDYIPDLRTDDWLNCIPIGSPALFLLRLDIRGSPTLTGRLTFVTYLITGTLYPLPL